MEIRGYLIQNQEGSYLAEGHYWYQHETFNDAWVHPKGLLEGILEQSRKWDSKPATLTRAIHNTDEKSTTLVSDAIDIQGLDVTQVRELLNKTS